MFLASSCTLSLFNLMKPGVKSRMKMQLEQRRQVMLQLCLCDQHFYYLLRCILYERFEGNLQVTGKIECHFKHTLSEYIFIINIVSILCRTELIWIYCCMELCNCKIPILVKWYLYAESTLMCFITLVFPLCWDSFTGIGEILWLPQGSGVITLDISAIDEFVIIAKHYKCII